MPQSDVLQRHQERSASYEINSYPYKINDNFLMKNNTLSYLLNEKVPVQKLDRALQSPGAYVHPY